MLKYNDYHSWPTLGAVSNIMIGFGIFMMCSANISFKNIRGTFSNLISASLLSFVIWYLIGWNMAFGDDYSLFIGSTQAPLLRYITFSNTLFTWSYLVISVCIILTALAERSNFNAVAFLLKIFCFIIFPFVMHWTWAEGWASPMRSSAKDALLIGCGAIDVSGSGVIFLCAATVATVAVIMIGPRKEKFSDIIQFPRHRKHHKYLIYGSLFILCGWQGMSFASSFVINGSYDSAGVGLASSILSALFGLLTTLSLGYFYHKIISMELALNGMISGLVAVSASCAVCDSYGGIFIGIIAAILYFLSSKTIPQLEIDDISDIISIYFVNGLWGIIAPGFFTAPSPYSEAYGGRYDDNTLRSSICCGILYGSWGSQFLANICLAFAIMAWSGGITYMTLTLLEYHMSLQSSNVADAGIENSHPTGSLRSNKVHIAPKETRGGTFFRNNGYSWDLVLVFPLESTYVYQVTT